LHDLANLIIIAGETVIPDDLPEAAAVEIAPFCQLVELGLRGGMVTTDIPRSEVNPAEFFGLPPSADALRGEREQGDNQRVVVTVVAGIEVPARAQPAVSTGHIWLGGWPFVTV